MNLGPRHRRDIGPLPVSADAAEGFLRLVGAAACERRAMAVGSNLQKVELLAAHPGRDGKEAVGVCLGGRVLAAHTGHTVRQASGSGCG
ncbi:hypothetical protein [Streptomyces sp. NPDC005476]|uniref:hypothetical protein n=1 Tax=Streptomyces sp. NPDC005476 TaxID=3156882 RepID=UPI003452BF11